MANETTAKATEKKNTDKKVDAAMSAVSAPLAKVDDSGAPMVLSSFATEAPKDFVDDLRSLPMYIPAKCDMVPVYGYISHATALGKNSEEKNSRKFLTFVIKLLAPTKAITGNNSPNETQVTVKAGDEIFLAGTDLRDLVKYATNPDMVWPFWLKPKTDEKGVQVTFKQSGKNPMAIWDRKRGKPQPRNVIFPNNINPPTLQEIKFLLSQNNDDDSFDPRDLEDQS